MPATVPPLDQDSFAQLRTGDEAALERFYRDRHDGLNELANAELQQPAAAGRVVEKVVLAAWQRRATFETPAALDEFLHQAIHEGALREKKRLAGIHRFESHQSKAGSTAASTTGSTADQAWEHITAALHARAADGELTGRALKAHQRHEAAHHIGDVARRGGGMKAAASVVGILLVVLGFVWFMFKVSGERAVTRALSMPDIRQQATREGQVGNVSLDDGTVVHMGAESKVFIPNRFNELYRAVKLIGTASFTIAANPALPFEVRAGNMAVIAKGTKFEVRADSGSRVVTVRVREGTVEAHLGKVVRTLTEGQAVTTDDDGKQMADIDAAQVEEQLGWADGRFVMHDRTLNQVLAQARRFYGARFEVRGGGLLERKLNIDCSIESSKDLIAALEANGLYFFWDKSVMVLGDSTLAPRTPARKKK
jgi:ferric-dicitrate binding protein FerR (iron transport regulator)